MNSLIELVDVKKSPLSRIMSIFDSNDPLRRRIENNICATHVGNGIVISVAHNLFAQVPFYRSVDEIFYQSKILAKLNPQNIAVMNSKYILDTTTQKRYSNATDADTPVIKAIFQTIGLDMRYCGLYKDNICKPFLIFNFDTNDFFNPKNNQYFDITNSFYEKLINKFTFIIELELLDYDFKHDFSIYKFTDKYLPLASAVPSIDMNFEIHDNTKADLYCLQGAPADNLGRMVNRTIIEGYIDQFSNLGMFNGQMHYFEGLRYLIKGYFRFGSSGAPYVFFDEVKKSYFINAVQSEACPQQLLIGNNRDGNAQYINAIASPLINVESMIKKYKT